MTFDTLQLISGTDDANLMAKAHTVTAVEWPEFMMHDPIAVAHFHCLYDNYPEFQFVAVERDSGAVAAVGNCGPVLWDQPIESLPDRGWDWALEDMVATGGLKDQNYLCALQIVVSARWRGKGLSHFLLDHMKSVGRRHGLPELLAPVRPNAKAEFPDLPMGEYLKRTTPDGLPQDPWLRVHRRQGADIVKVCHESMLIDGTVQEWQGWTGLTFKASGAYIIPGALRRVRMDLDSNLGTYVEPNVWVHHRRP
jgi:GNAT superfamily N-acetyltransferase